jgi:putative membrane protein
MTPSVAYAQGMMGLRDSRSEVASDNHTAREESEGKEIWEKLQTKQLECKDLTDENFDSLGEYFMGQMAGRFHEAMNNMMTQMMGEKGEQQMHVVMGKRFSGCNTSVQFPQNGVGFMPMMGMMGGGGNPMMGNFGWNNMMSGWSGFGLGWIYMILFWGLVILGIVALVKWIASVGKTDFSKTPLDILKARYAKGGIDKKNLKKWQRYYLSKITYIMYAENSSLQPACSRIRCVV